MYRIALKLVLAALLICTALSGVAHAHDVQISGVVAFSALDGSSDDHDGIANGLFTVNDGNLVIDGTVQCNDGPPLPGHASACPIRISVSGDLVLEAGGAIVAENRSGGGSGANITLEVGGDLILHGPSGALPGAVVSSGSMTNTTAAGSISASVGGSAELEAGSIISAGSHGGKAGAVGIDAGGGIRIAGLVASGPGTSLLASRWSGAVLSGGSSKQAGGTILLRSTSAGEPGIRIEATGTVVSQGQSSGPQFVLLEACGIEVHGLVAAVSKNDTPARIALRSGNGILVDGRDLASGSGSHLGRVRADSLEAGAATHLVDLFAEADIQIFGPTSGTTDLFAVSSNPGTQFQRTGGSVNAVSIAGALAASGNAFDAGRALSGNKGGKIDLRSAGDVDLADAHLRAVGGYLAASGSRRGGQISVRSYSGEIRWTFGTGDVRPTGSGTSAASRGTIMLTACSGIDTTGTTFPVLGSPVAPFPVEADGVCSPAAPSLPSGEPPLPVCNVPPTAVDDAATVTEDSSNNAIDVLANDTDTDGGPKSVASVTQPANGAVSITGGGTGVSYTPDADYCNNPPGTTPDTFTYTLNGGSAATVSVTVTCADDDPTAVNDAATVAEDSSNNAIDVLANDTDEDGGTTSVDSVTQPANGVVSITGGGTGVSYTPNASYCNSVSGTPDTFTYTLSPGGSTATVSVTVTCADDDPTAVNDAAMVSEDSSNNAIDVLANDMDGDGGPKSVASVTQPVNGAVSITGGGTGVSYTPNANYCNSVSGTPDTFTYTLSPGGSTATVSVTVSCVDDPPTAVIDTATVSEDSGANTINVQANDADIDGGTNTVSGVTQPANGTVVITNGGLNLTYAPNANYCNSVSGTPDTFSYTLTPGGSTATVSVTVACVNDGPGIDLDADNDKGTAGSDFATTFTEGDPATLIEDPVDSTVTDIDSATIASLTVTITNLLDIGNEILSADVTGTSITANYVADATTGVLTLTGPDTLANFETVLRKVRYLNSDTSPGTTPRVIHYVANDGTTNGNTAVSTVTIVGVDSSPTAVNDSATVNEDSGATAIDVLANDTDPDGGPISVASVTQPANGTVSITGGGTGVSYTPNGSYCNSVSGTPDTFTYTLSPGGSSATVSVTVTCLDDNPTAVNDTATVTEDASATAIDVLANDTDADGGAKSITSVTQPANGTVVITGGGTGLTYQPSSNYCNSVSGTPDTFTYTLSPGGSIATVSVTVTCVDDDPAAVNDAATVVEDSSGNEIDVLANDTDVDGGAKSVTSVTQPANGAVSITGGGTGVSYTPNANYCGAESFTYTLTPGGSAATVSVTVTCVDDPPVAVNDAETVLEDSGANAIDVLANDTDIDAGPKSVQSVTQAANGSVAITGGGTGVSYTPAANFCGSNSFTYTLNGGSTATVSVTVTCVNDAPLLGDSTIDYTILGNTQLRVGEDTSGNSLLHIRDNSDVNEKSLPSDVDGPGPLTVVPFTGNSTSGGNVVLNADGTFTYESAPGFTGTDTFPFTVTDNGAPAATTSGTVSITVSETVWYVHDVTGPDNPEPSDTGRSTNAFENLEDVAAVLTDNDYIFVFRGNTGTTPHGGIRINKTGVKLHGEGVGLTVPGFGTLIPAGNQPFIDNAADVPAQEDHGVAVDASVASLNGVEIRGLVIEGRDNGIDVTATGANSVALTISNNTITSDATTGLEGVDVNANGTGMVTVTVSNNSLNGRGNAFDARTGAASALRIDLSNNANIFSNASGVVIDGAGGGTTTITGFANNSVHPNTGGTGINVNAATFDVTPGGAFQTVGGGTTVVGAPGAGNGVGAQGVVLTNVTGDLAFTDLDVFADGGAGLRVGGTGAVDIGAGTGTRLTVGVGVGIVEASGGPAVDANNATVDLQLTSLRSTTPNMGVSLVNVSDGTTPAMFSAGSGSSIVANSGAGPAFNVSGGNAGISYGGTITNNGTGRAVSITTWSGDDASDNLLLSGSIDENGAGILLNGNGGTRAITFSGGMDVDTTSGEGFAATSNTNSLGLHVTGSANDVSSISATALRVTSTAIGSSNLNFRNVSSGNNTAAADPANGIVLNATGTLGRLIITGTGSSGQGGNGSGGLIQNTGNHGILLTDTMNPSFTNMSIQGTGGSGVNGTLVAGFTFDNGTINNSGTAGAADDSNISFNDSSANVSGTVTVTDSVLTNSRYHGVDIQHYNGTIAHADIQNNSITSAASIATSLGSAIRLDAFGAAATVGHVTRATINNNVITNFPAGAGIHAFGGNSSGSGPAGTFGVPGSGSDVIAITNNLMNGGSLGVGNQPDRFFTGGVNGSGQGNFNISGNGTAANPITNIDGVVIELNQFGTGSMTATVNNNRIVANNAVGSAGINVGCDADASTALDNAVVSATISGNNVSDTDGPGIFAIARGSDCSLTARILSNTVAAPDTTTAARAGIRVDSGSAAGDTTLCLEISGNTTAGSTNTSTSTTSPGINLRKQATSTTVNIFGIEGLSPSPTGTPNVENHVNGLNTSTSGTFGVNGTALLSGTSGFTNCLAP
jgi:hypothetical protein